MPCSWCQRGRFEGFLIRCSLADELVDPKSKECDEFIPKDQKASPEQGEE